MKRKVVVLTILFLIVGAALGIVAAKLYYKYYSSNPEPRILKVFSTDSTHQVEKTYQIGDVVDEFNGVKVYYNGYFLNTTGRNVAPDGYNLGIKYQCVEFVKRYYYEYLHHKMPDSYGNAKDFFDTSLADGSYNPKRDLYQYTNNSKYKPQPNDLVIWNGNSFNPYGHVAIIADTGKYDITIVQQNPGPNAPSRELIPYVCYKGKWKILGTGIIGWLRKK